MSFFSTKYRIEIHRENCLEPQVWRWWWPFWVAIASCSYTGHDWSPWVAVTMEEAVEAIEYHKKPIRRPRTFKEIP